MFHYGSCEHLKMRVGVGPKWDCWNAIGPTEAFFFAILVVGLAIAWLAFGSVGILAIVDRERSNCSQVVTFLPKK